MRHIVHIAAYYPPHVGGMENMIRSLVEALASRRMEVTVLTSTIGASDSPRHETASWVTIRRLRAFEKAHTPLIWTLPYWLCKMPKHSLFHVHIAQAFIPELTLLIGRLRGIPVIGHFHLDVQPSGKLGAVFVIYKKLLLKPTLRRLDRVIVFSKAQKQLLETTYGVSASKIDVIPNAVDEQFFRSSSYRSRQKHMQLLFVGRLSKQKRVDRLIEAMSRLSVPATLHIVGGGELESQLRAQVKSLGLQSVIFEGYKRDAALRAAYQSADALVISSDLEGCPLVVLEAMAMKLPIIGTDVLGIRELVQSVGLLAGEPFAENLATAIDRLSREKNLPTTLSAKSAKRSRQYTWTRLLHTLSKTYREVSL